MLKIYILFWRWWRSRIFFSGKKITHASTRNESVKQVLVAWPCPALCDTIDCSPPVSSVHGIFQARMLEWVAIPLLQENLPAPGIEPGSPTLKAGSLISEPPHSKGARWEAGSWVNGLLPKKRKWGGPKKYKNYFFNRIWCFCIILGGVIPKLG